MPQKTSLPWLATDDAFPPTHLAWDQETGMSGLLAAGADLSVPRLKSAYSKGIFPWFSEGQPILWWSPSPRMVLQVHQFKRTRSLRQTIKKWSQSGLYRLSVDQAFDQVIRACALTARPGSTGTWISPSMQRAYQDLHQAGHAHSIEVWRNERLIGGLYLINLGHGVFGESMFFIERDASKVALWALVSLCKAQGASWIDCQQQTPHLASLGAAPISRVEFETLLARDRLKADLNWSDRWIYWDRLLGSEDPM